MSDTEFIPANHYVFDSGGIAGTFDTTSLAGDPAATVGVDGIAVDEVAIERHADGWMLSGYVDGRPDAYSRSLTAVLPTVNTDGGSTDFEGLAVVVTHRTSIGGTKLLQGAIEQYDVRTINGTASIVDF